MENAHKIRLEIPSEAEYIGVARHAVEFLATGMSLDPTTVQDVKLAVGEACNNAVRHGTPCTQHPCVNIIYTVSPDALQIEISNKLAGDEPCPTIIARPDHSKEGGFGLYIMRKLMDEVNIEWEDHTATVRMVKRLNRA